jgi:tetrahydromethanopterin S-methyltransferase subunit G
MPVNDVKTLHKRLDQMEAKLEKHLEESGEIRTDLAWIKRLMFAAIGLACTATAGVVVQIFLVLVKK